MATVPGQTRQLHPLVTLDYRVRMVSMVVVALIPLFHFRGRPPLPVLAGMIFSGLLWPQIAYLVAKNSKDSRAAEFRNLLLDSFFVGCWTAEALGAQSGRPWAAGRRPCRSACFRAP